MYAVNGAPVFACLADLVCMEMLHSFVCAHAEIHTLTSLLFEVATNLLQYIKYKPVDCSSSRLYTRTMCTCTIELQGTWSEVQRAHFNFA